MTRYDLPPDPAAHLLADDDELWAKYRGRTDADPADRAAWIASNAEIMRIRHEARWPPHHYRQDGDR
jgi:hypothetical protein